VRPTRRTLLLALALLPLALLPTLLGPELWTLWLAAVGGLLLALCADVALALPPAALRVGLETPRQVAIGAREQARLTLEAPGRSLRVRVWPTLSEPFEPVGPTEVGVADGHGALEVPLVPSRRGTGHVLRAWLRWQGPLGLVALQRVVSLERAVPVVPNLAPVRRLALRWFTPRESAQGLKVERYVGDGTEFEAMREYVQGLDPRGMSWKQTARHRKLICQEFRAERNHALVVAVDAGHLMSEPVRGVPKVDHAVSAGLVLAYGALRTGDRVGLYAFDAKPRQWMAPAGGAAAFPRLSHRAAEIDYADSETNFTLCLAELGARLRRRTLVVLLTDFVDTITAELMLQNLARLARRHVLIFVALSDPAWQELSEQPPSSPTALYESVVAAEFGQERQRVLERLRRLGVTCVDARPEQVSAELLNRYLDLKRREVLG
jgi:uncharacterized protein (DUF58 family)